MTIPLSLLLKVGVPLLGFAGLLSASYFLGSSHGEARIQKEWNAQKDADAKLVQDEKDKLAYQEAAHREQIRKVDYALVEIATNNAANIARINSESALRLRDSEQRASVYRAASEAGATERANLASYAAQLDRSLTEGIGLVDELRTTLAVRDGQIQAIGAQLQADRQLISGTVSNDQ